jgi:ABC-2 type transport system permease protein
MDFLRRSVLSDKAAGRKETAVRRNGGEGVKTKAFKIAKWEFLEKVQSKAFIVSLVLMPVILIGIAFVPALFSLKEDDESVVVGIIDKTQCLLEPLDLRLRSLYTIKNGQPNYILRNLDDRESLDELKNEANSLIAQGKMDGYFYIPATAMDSGKIEFHAKNVSNIKIQERFSRAIEKVLIERRLDAHGLDPDLIHKLTTSIEVQSVKISEEGTETKVEFGETFIMAYIGILMITFMVITSGQLLVRSMLEEKSNRVIEILLSSCSTRDLMAGKIIGLSGLGILQMLVYALIGLAVALKMGVSVVDPLYFALTLLYAILGYLFYAAVLVAAGSPVTTEQEAQQITSYISLLLVAPMGLMIVVMQNPHSLWVRVMSYIPPFTPSLMVMRLAIQMPSTLEIILTLLLLLLSTVGMMWIAGKIFRTAILSYGKRPTIGELLQWIKEK